MSLPLPSEKLNTLMQCLPDAPFKMHMAEEIKAYGQACRAAALEEAAVCAWNHYMDTCKSNNIAPASSERWLVSGKIRSLKP